MTYAPPISKLEPIEYVYPKLSKITAYSHSKLYDSSILACHDSFISETESQREPHHFDATCLRRQLRKSLRKLNAFHMTYAPPISKLEPMEYVYPKLSKITAYSHSKRYDSFIYACHDSFIRESESQRKPYHFDLTCLHRQLRKSTRKQDTFLIAKLQHMEYVYPKLSNITAYSHSKLIMIHSFLHVMIHSSTKRKVRGNHIILMQPAYVVS